MRNVIVDAKSPSAEKLINPSGKTSLVFLLCFLTVTTIAFEYLQHSDRPFGLLLFPFLACSLGSALLGVWTIPVLQRLKTGQIVREDGPQSHLKKAGTPTMGGIFFVPVAVFGALMGAAFTDFWTISPELIAVCLLTLSYGTLGWLDDWQVLRQKSNKGISPRMKLIFQVGCGALFSCWLFWYRADGIASISLPGGISFNIGWLFLPLAIFVLTAESNATNLTDGVDGLAAGTGAIALLGLGAVISPNYPDLALFCACLSGGCLGFLAHNRNPAKVFMGDTGSLALGGALAAVGLSSGNLWVLFVVSGLFFVESLSVIAQVSYYKATKGENGKGKRLFKMAPIHHHFELSGWQETQVVGLFYLVGLLLVAIAFLVR